MKQTTMKNNRGQRNWNIFLKLTGCRDPKSIVVEGWRWPQLFGYWEKITKFDYTDE